MKPASTSSPVFGNELSIRDWRFEGEQAKGLYTQATAPLAMKNFLSRFRYGYTEVQCLFCISYYLTANQMCKQSWFFFLKKKKKKNTEINYYFIPTSLLEVYYNPLVLNKYNQDMDVVGYLMASRDIRVESNICYASFFSSVFVVAPHLSMWQCKYCHGTHGILLECLNLDPRKF